MEEEENKGRRSSMLIYHREQSPRPRIKDQGGTERIGSAVDHPISHKGTHGSKTVPDVPDAPNSHHWTSGLRGPGGIH